MGRRPKSFAGKTASSISLSPSLENSATIATAENPQEKPAETPQENPQNSPQENFPRAAKERLSWPISDAGKFDVEGFRKETAEQAREIAKKSFLDPDFRKWAGIEQETGVIAEAIFPNQIAGQALDLIASLETLAMSKKLGLSYDECHKFMAWNAKEHEVLDAQGARIARKYIPAKWLENMDAYIFCATIAGLATMKMKAATEFAEKRLEQIGKATDKDMGKAVETLPENPIETRGPEKTRGAVGPSPNGNQNSAEGKSLE